MNRLSQELADSITSFIPQNEVKNILTLTREFWYAAERYSGAFAQFTINERNSQIFLERYSGRRLQYLREVIFRPTFPTIFFQVEVERPSRESKEELERKDESFTHQIKQLFTTLKLVEEQAADTHRQGRYRLMVYSPITLVDSIINRDSLHHHYSSWRVHLLSPAELPQIASVRSLEIYNRNCQEDDWQHYGDGCEPRYPSRFDRVESKLDLRVILEMAAKLLNLEFLGFQGGGYEWSPLWHKGSSRRPFENDWEGPRRNARHDFASAITSCGIQLPSLQRASLDFLNPLDQAIDFDHLRALPNLVSPALKDPFSSSLRIMSQNLRQLRIRAMIDDSLFWSANDAAPFWPNLEVLEVTFHTARPDGKWYFQGPEGEGHDAAGFDVTKQFFPPLGKSEDAWEKGYAEPRDQRGIQFRISTHEANLKPLLEAFANTALRLPSLKKALIWSPLSWLHQDNVSDFHEYDVVEADDLAWGIIYSEPGFPPLKHFEYHFESYLSKSCPSRLLGWMVDDWWRPDSELQDLFRQIGRGKHGDKLKELFPIDFGYDTIVTRDWFEDFMFENDPGCIPPPT